MRFYKGSIKDALQKGTKIVESRSRYIRAMNIIMADKSEACLYTFFNQDEDYFTLFSKKDKNKIMICSDPFPGEKDWIPLENRTIKEL